MRRLVSLFMLAFPAFAVPPKEALDALQVASEGFVAVCKQSPIDELQVMRGPKKLTKEEVAALAAILGHEDNYRNDGWKKFCIVYWDFKIFLYDQKDYRPVALRVCTSCNVIGVQVTYESARGGELLPDPMEQLQALFTEWFPDWRSVAKTNRTAR